MRLSIRDFAGKASRAGTAVVLLIATSYGAGQHKVTVPTRPLQGADKTTFRDRHYGVRFQVPPGWELSRKDRQVSTFRLDARTAPRTSQMRGVASLGFNPYPASVLSGALLYFSVARHSSDESCAAEARSPEISATQTAAAMEDRTRSDDSQNIGGMQFLHGHDEYGGICVEARDEVYTAFRKGSCYRFDLTLNTFCSVSSGASELTREQVRNLESQMVGILSTVSLDWEKSGPQPVPVPDVPAISPQAKPRRDKRRNATGT